MKNCRVYGRNPDTTVFCDKKVIKISDFLLTNNQTHGILYKVRKTSGQTIEYAAVAQSVERRIGSAEVTGPIPVSSLF